jgi:four helix bundle protein
MTYQRLEDTRVYIEALAIADEVWEEVATWSFFERDTVGKQLVRAADSVSANIAEFYGRHSTGDVALFLYYSRGSLYETKDWLKKAIRRGLGRTDCLNQILGRVETLAPQLNAYITIKKKNLRTQTT